jgi:Uncharacterised protein family (UPF0220)
VVLQEVLLTVCRINSIDKTRLSGDSYSYTGSGVAWKARVILFVGFAFMAGGLAGSVTVLVLKYLVHHYPFPTLQFGVSNVISNALVMLRYQLPRPPPLPRFPQSPGVGLRGILGDFELC